MRYSSQVYQNLVQQTLYKYGNQAFVGFQSDMNSLSQNLENLYNERSIESFLLGLSDLIDRGYNEVKYEVSHNYMFKFIDFQHFYVAFKHLEEKHSSIELEKTLNILRHKLDDYCEIMAKELEDFKI